MKAITIWVFSSVDTPLPIKGGLSYWNLSRAQGLPLLLYLINLDDREAIFRTHKHVFFSLNRLVMAKLIWRGKPLQPLISHFFLLSSLWRLSLKLFFIDWRHICCLVKIWMRFHGLTLILPFNAISFDGNLLPLPFHQLRLLLWYLNTYEWSWNLRLSGYSAFQAWSLVTILHAKESLALLSNWNRTLMDLKYLSSTCSVAKCDLSKM